MQTGEEKRILLGIARACGPDADRLSRTLIHGFGAIGRGRLGDLCDEYLARKLATGVLRTLRGAWVYVDPQGSTIIAGGVRDSIVIPGVAKIAALSHARKGRNGPVDELWLQEKLAQSALRVDRIVAAWHIDTVGLMIPEDRIR